MRPRVAGMVWLPKAEADPDLLEHLRRKLTFIPRKVGNYGDDTIKEPVRCYVDAPMEFGVPRAFWFANSKNSYEYEWDVSHGTPMNGGEKLETTLRHVGRYAEQADVIKVFEGRFLEASTGFPSDNERGLQIGGIFQADTGFGKTDTAIGLARQIGNTTIILTHKEFLMRQWVARIRKWLPTAKVGIVRESKCEFEGCDFVVGMMQSLSLDDGTRYPADLYDWAGLLIVDETHRVGAPTWAPLPPKFTAAYRLGLTATPRRKDDADVVFWWHIGQIVYKAKTEMPKPHVRFVMLPKPHNSPDVLTTPGKNDATVITVLTKMTGRNRRVTNEVVKALKSTSGRKVMVLSERLEHLRVLESELRETISQDSAFEHEDITTDFYVGDWFTGEKVPPLKSAHWPMEDGGRERAIDLIYKSVSRRKGYSGEIDVVDLLDDDENIVFDEHDKPIPVKIHIVRVPASDMANLFGDESFFDMDGSCPITLEELQDDELYGMAVWYKIRQKAKDKMKPRTEAELAKAERARVMYCTFQMVSEGIDIPAIDLLVLATPVSDIEQAAGRSRRFCDPDPEKCDHFCPWRAEKCQGKSHPIIADFVDLGYPLATKRERYREAFYSKLGCKIAKGRA